MLQGSCIYVRPEVLFIYIWDRSQELKAKRSSRVTERMFSEYLIQGTDTHCPELYKKIIDMARDASEVFVLHEAGEAYEDEYSDDWREILSEGCDKATELFLRGIGAGRFVKKSRIAGRSFLPEWFSMKKSFLLFSLYNQGSHLATGLSVTGAGLGASLEAFPWSTPFSSNRMWSMQIILFHPLVWSFCWW